MSSSKRFLENYKVVDRLKEYGVDEAVSILKDGKPVRFDETVEVAVNLGIDPRHSDQIVRGTVALPHGTGKDVKVLVFAKGDKVAEAEAAGADFVGGAEFVAKIKEGWTGIDVIVATPDMMAEVGKIGRILGPRGLMPNPKSGTVTMDVAKAVSELKAGKIEFRCEKSGIVHVGVGKLSFEADQISANIKSFMDAIMRARPAASKGTYLKKISVTSSMGPGLKIDKASVV
ncbi:MAG: 50S ribosomal protein L1 [Candidatus Marinimicrobia bacterium]|nr:50S ribosomal protein L1 [Candidatus Neomarinimicrobiota bacterium]